MENIHFFDCIHDNQLLILTGLRNTIIIFFISASISFFLGFLWGALREKTISHIIIGKITEYIAYIFQGIPFYLQLLIHYFIIGPFFGIYDEMIIGIISLGICSAAYTSQIIVTAIKSIEKEQLLLADNLGYSKYQKIKYIIIPQIIPYIIPLFISECDQLIKSISILSTIGILEITRSGLNIINTTFKPFPVYVFLVIVYLSFSILLRSMARIAKSRFESEQT
jgi:polar amino acid transport system permease protein